MKMYGPAFDGSGRIVNRDVPAADVVAFEHAGYIKGEIADAQSVPAETGAHEPAGEAAAAPPPAPVAPTPKRKTRKK